MIANEGSSQNMPIEYWISRATDPYLNAEARKLHLQTLCDRVNCELEGAQIAISVLSHRVVSPDQDEALYALQVVDQLVLNCGEKVHVLVGKFRFLNQLVKLLTPKYLGNQTSPEVKRLTIRLLYTWQRHIRHIEGFKEVYATLKEHKIIDEDPEIEEDSVIVMQANPSHNRRAAFETDETIARLKKLVKEDNVEAANEYIRKLLKEREEKEEKECERVNNLQKATALCDELQQLHIEKTTEAIGFAPADNPEQRMERIEKLFEQLYALRSTIQLYVQEAAERNDESLMEMIAINERVNMWIKRSYDKANSDQLRRGDNGSKEECEDLLGGTLPEEELYTTSPSTSNPLEKSNVEIPKLPPPPFFIQPETVDVPFIGFNRDMTPQLGRRTVKSTIVTDIKSPIQEFNPDLNALFDTSPPHKFPQPSKPTLNQLTNSSLEAKISSNKLDGIVLSSRDPISVIDKMNIRLLLYRTVHEINPSVETFIIAATNCGTQSLEDVYVTVKSNSQVCQLRLEPTEKFTLPGITIQKGAPPKFLVLHCLQYQESREVDMNVSICFKLQFERTITSNITVSLI